MIKAVIFDMFETLITHYDCPLYFGKQMAEDMGIEEDYFRQIWNPSEDDRTIGRVSLEEIVEQILRSNDKYSEELFNKIVKKRKDTKRECFRHLHEEIIPMLEGLKHSGYQIGLITNCFSEEAEVIRDSILYPYFDVPCLSCEEGVQKPDKEIFARCLERLGLRAEECIYIGDGGSQELETARGLGMHAMQAVWYLKEGTSQQMTRKRGFIQLESPCEIERYLVSGLH